MQNRDESRRPGISLRRRFILLLVAWALAAAAVAVIYPVPEAAPMFPFGLFLVVGIALRELSVGHSGPNMSISPESVATIGWLLYAALTGGALLARRKIVYFVIYGILCVLLLINVGGCRALGPPGTNLM